ncbi:hypothetical protein [Pseudomonas sp. BN515]|uniref:hypothetical protein n=1 Tax=Pseudomonas sp. BN515 TaxID=2567892 RepID=UPI002456AA0F|nr:hypothetical protein [Pseudomonas sp. BN515]MDH4873008.1 hypothetical protein [Pseudomonas sp. BN515]
MQPARLDLPVIQGATFRQILRIMQPELAYRPITAIASTSPVRLTVEHGLPTDWPVWVRGVAGFPALNKEFPRALPHLAQVVDAQHLDINPLAATGLLPKGGELSYYLPVSLSGVVATLKVLDASGAVLLSVVPTVHAGGWVEVELTDEQTTALTWKEGVWYLDLAFPNGENYRAFTGQAKVYPVGAAPSATCEGAWVLTAGGQGVPGPMGPAFKVDALGPLAERDQYDDEDVNFAYLALDNGLLYLREGAPGGWTDGVPFQGPAGDDGRSITGVAVNGSGHLIITYSDGNTSDAGAIPAAPTVWGTIGGTLLDQDDLVAALAGKATSAQGAKADSAVQPGDLAPVATSGSYPDLQDKPFIPATPGDVGAATAEQGAKADAAVQPSDLAAGLAGKVDKEAGKGLSQENFTSAEKAKLAGLESSHFKGVFASLAALEAALPTAAAGDYADVDAGEGVDTLRYIWDVSDLEWVLSGSGAPLTAAQVKTLYESNPDTNGFTDAEQDKLAGVATGATKNSNTDELVEGASNLYFTTARVLATVLSGLSLATGGAIVSTDTVQQAFGKIQRQLNDHFGQGGSVHALATTVVAGFMSAADKAKLDGVATGATANDTDANLKSRANHTGTQVASTISDFSEAVDDRVASLLVAGTNITLTYNDAANTLTIAASGGGGAAGDILATLVNAEVGISAATTLTSTAFGKLHVCTGTSADYTVGLPAVAGNAGKFIGLRMSPALTKIVTLDPNGVETINGATTRKMAANETVILYCDGSAWTVLARGDRAVLEFSASKVSAVQSIANGTSTKITFETEDFDFGGGYNPATSVFTVPANGAGKWVFGASLVFQGTASDDVISIRLYKNGSQVGNIGHAPAGRPNTGGPSGITFIDVAAGDTLEIYGRLDTTSGARDVYGAAGTSRFYGFKVD